MTEHHVELDPINYLRPPVVDTAAAVSLAAALISALPKSAGPATRAAAQRLREAAVALQSAWIARDAKKEDPRPFDNRLDRAWSGLRSRLLAYADLPAESYPEVKRAVEILEILFPEGLEFLSLPYASQWAESKRRLALIEDRKLATDVDSIAGHLFLAEVKAAHERYGEVLRISKAQPGVAADVAERLKAVTRAIPDYALKVLAEAEVSDPDSVRVARDALRPIDAFRAAANARQPGGTPAAGPAPSQPIPPVP